MDFSSENPIINLNLENNLIQNRNEKVNKNKQLDAIGVNNN